jgi:adenylate kinase
MSEISTKQKRDAVREWLGAGAINIFGIQFSGKDTQLNRLQSWLGGVVLGGGDISRQIMDQLPEYVRKATLAGELIPLEYFLKLMPPVLGHDQHRGKPLLLSAVGRWHGEEEGVTRSAEEAGHHLKAVIWLEMDEDLSWKRWKHMPHVGDRTERVDDAAEGLSMRLKWFREKTLPVKDYYAQRGLVISVDASKSPDEVEAAILDGLYELAVKVD